VESINRALTSRNFVWNFTKTLTRSFRLPRALEPTDAIGLTAAAGEVRVTTESLVFTVSFQASVSRRRGEESPGRGPAEARRSVHSRSAAGGSQGPLRPQSIQPLAAMLSWRMTLASSLLP